MIEGWVLGLALFFTVLLGIVIFFQIRISTQNEIIVRAIPLGTPKILERRPPSPNEDRRVPNGATARHGNGQ